MYGTWFSQWEFCVCFQHLFCTSFLRARGPRKINIEPKRNLEREKKRKMSVGPPPNPTKKEEEEEEEGLWEEEKSNYYEQWWGEGRSSKKPNGRKRRRVPFMPSLLSHKKRTLLRTRVWIKDAHPYSHSQIFPSVQQFCQIKILETLHLQYSHNCQKLMYFSLLSENTAGNEGGTFWQLGLIGESCFCHVVIGSFFLAPSLFFWRRSLNGLLERSPSLPNMVHLSDDDDVGVWRRTRMEVARSGGPWSWWQRPWCVRCLPKQATLSNVWERGKKERRIHRFVLWAINACVCGHCFAQDFSSSPFHTVVTDCPPLMTW